MPPLTADPMSALDRLNADGYVVIEGLIDRDTVHDLRARVERRLAYEREHPFDPGGHPTPVRDQVEAAHFANIWELSDDESERLARRNGQRQAEEFDTPWPVRAAEVCISFIHIPSCSTTAGRSGSST